MLNYSINPDFSLVNYEKGAIIYFVPWKDDCLSMTDYGSQRSEYRKKHKGIKKEKSIMKKSVAKFISLALVLVCMLGLVACGGGGADVSGTYKLTEVSMSGMSVNLEDLAAGLGKSMDDLMVDLELKSDGKFNFDLSDLDPSLKMDGTYKASGKTVTLTTSDDEKIICTLEGDTLTMSEEEGGVTASMVFKKK